MRTRRFNHTDVHPSTGSGGGIKRSQAYMRHILTKKSTKRKRHLRGTTEVDPTNKRQIRAMLPYSS